jgi:hypothetical protein
MALLLDRQEAVLAVLEPLKSCCSPTVLSSEALQIGVRSRLASPMVLLLAACLREVESPKVPSFLLVAEVWLLEHLLLLTGYLDDSRYELSAWQELHLDLAPN